MGFFIGMFLCNMLIPLIMVFSGYMMYKHPPKDINGLVRTANPNHHRPDSFCEKQ